MECMMKSNGKTKQFKYILNVERYNKLQILFIEQMLKFRSINKQRLKIVFNNSYYRYDLDYLFQCSQHHFAWRVEFCNKIYESI